MSIEQELSNRIKFLEANKKYLLTSKEEIANALEGVRKAKAYIAWHNLNTLKEIIKRPELVAVFLTAWRNSGYKEALKKIQEITYVPEDTLTINEQYAIWLQKNNPGLDELDRQKTSIESFQYQPKISLIVPTYNTNIEYFKEMVESIKKQTYSNWELCIADDASTDLELKKEIVVIAKQDSRIKYILRSKNGHICAASNSAIELATGEFIGLVDHDDVLQPSALYENVRIMQKAPDVDLLYSDEDKIELDNQTRVDPFMKPEWSPDYLRSINYITHFCVIRKRVVDEIKGFRLGTQGTQDWDIILRATERIEKLFKGSITEMQQEKIVHIPKILYSWRKSETSTASESHISTVKNYAFVNQGAVLKDDLQRRNLKGEILEQKGLGLWYTRYKLIGLPKVSIIIPTKDKFDYISRCLTSIYETTTYKNFEVIIVDTGSTESAVQKLYTNYKASHHGYFKVVKWSEPFNFAAVCNLGSKKASGDHLLFLNNDTEVITPTWIEDLLIFSQQERVGAVGAKLLYPDGSVQHAGVVTGMGVASHYMQHSSDDSWQAFPMLYAKDAVRDVSAVTGACLMIKKKLFFECGALDEKFRIAYNDVDFCLRLFHKYNKWNVYNPNVVLKHHESISVGVPEKGTRDAKEFISENRMMYDTWGHVLRYDPFYSPSLTMRKEDFSLDI